MGRKRKSEITLEVLDERIRGLEENFTLQIRDLKEDIDFIKRKLVGVNGEGGLHGRVIKLETYIKLLGAGLAILIPSLIAIVEFLF